MLFVNIAPKTPDVSFICLLDCSVALSLRSNYTCPILVGVARIAEALESDAYQNEESEGYLQVHVCIEFD